MTLAGGRSRRRGGRGRGGRRARRARRGRRVAGARVRSMVRRTRVLALVLLGLRRGARPLDVPVALVSRPRLLRDRDRLALVADRDLVAVLVLDDADYAAGETDAAERGKQDDRAQHRAHGCCDPPLPASVLEIPHRPPPCWIPPVHLGRCREEDNLAPPNEGSQPPGASSASSGSSARARCSASRWAVPVVTEARSYQVLQSSSSRASERWRSVRAAASRCTASSASPASWSGCAAHGIQRLARRAAASAAAASPRPAAASPAAPARG